MKIADIKDLLNQNLNFLNAVFGSNGNWVNSEDSFEIEMIDIEGTTVTLFVCHDTLENEKATLKHVKENVNIYQLAFKHIEEWFKRFNYSSVVNDEIGVYRLYRDTIQVCEVKTNSILEAQFKCAIKAFEIESRKR